MWVNTSKGLVDAKELKEACPATASNSNLKKGELTGKSSNDWAFPYPCLPNDRLDCYMIHGNEVWGVGC